MTEREREKYLLDMQKSWQRRITHPK